MKFVNRALLCLVLLPSIASAQGFLGSLFGPGSGSGSASGQLSKLSEEIDAAPTDWSSLNTLWEIQAKLKHETDQKNSKWVEVRSKWSSKYLEVIEAEIASTTDRTLLRSIRRFLNDEEVELYEGGTQFAGALAKVQAAIRSIEHGRSSVPPQQVPMTRAEGTATRPIEGASGNRSEGVDAQGWALAEENRQAEEDRFAKEAGERHRAEAQRREQLRKDQEASELKDSSRRATLQESWVAKHQGQLPQVAAEVAASKKSALEVCKARFKEDVHQQSCINGLLNPNHWGQTRYAHYVRANHEIRCPSPAYTSCPLDAKTYAALLEVISGKSPTSCAEYVWAKLSTAQAHKLDRSWTVQATPSGNTKVINGLLVNFRERRFIVREVVMDDLRRRMAGNPHPFAPLAMVMIEAAAGSEINRGQPRWAVVQTSPKTVVFGSGELEKDVSAVGLYRRNEYLRLANGAEVPAASIEAVCVESK